MRFRDLFFRALFLAAFVVALISCQKETIVPVQETAATGTGTLTGPPENVAAAKVDTTLAPVTERVLQQCRVGADATSEKTEFAKDEPVYFTMALKEAPEKLQVSVKVLDAKDKELTTIRQAGEDKNVVTFKIDPAPKAGEYRLEGYWGGNLVCEKTIEVK